MTHSLPLLLLEIPNPLFLQSCVFFLRKSEKKAQKVTIIFSPATIIFSPRCNVKATTNGSNFGFSLFYQMTFFPVKGICLKFLNKDISHMNSTVMQSQILTPFEYIQLYFWACFAFFSFIKKMIDDISHWPLIDN